jgi:hypothetical protein
MSRTYARKSAIFLSWYALESVIFGRPIQTGKPAGLAKQGDCFLNSIVHPTNPPTR